MAKLFPLILSVLFALGCTAPIEESETDMPWLDPNCVGQSKLIGPGWVEGKLEPVTQVPAGYFSLKKNAPEVLTVTLDAVPVYSAAPAITLTAWRWSVVVGVGGTQQEWIFDANGSQQISLAADAVTVSLLSNRLYADVTYIAPTDTQIRASAYIARGNVASSPATYTAMWSSLANGASISFGAQGQVPIPKGANGFRLLGTSANVAGSTGPFQATFTVLYGPLASPTEGFTGLDLFPATQGGAFIPLTAGTERLLLTNGTGAPVTNFGIQFSLDL